MNNLLDYKNRQLTVETGEPPAKKRVPPRLLF